jgi:hypothetical protein
MCAFWVKCDQNYGLWAYLSSKCQSLISTPAVQYLILMTCCSLFRWTVSFWRKCIAGWEMVQYMAIWLIWGWGESLADEWAHLGGDLAHCQCVLAHFGKRKKGYWRYHCNILDSARETHFHSPAHTKEKPPAMHPGVPTVFRNTHTHASSGLYPQLLGIQKP